MTTWSRTSIPRSSPARPASAVSRTSSGEGVGSRRVETEAPIRWLPIVVSSIPPSEPGVRLSTHPALHRLPAWGIAVVCMVAVAAQRPEVRDAVGSLAPRVVDSEQVRAPTVGAREARAHLGSELPFFHVHGLAWASYGADGIGEQMLGRAGLPLRVVLFGRVVHQIGVREPVPPFLEVARPVEFHRAGEPLVRLQGRIPFAYRGDPPRPVVDHPGLGRDELPAPASLVLAQQPVVVPVPGVAA